VANLTLEEVNKGYRRFGLRTLIFELERICDIRRGDRRRVGTFDLRFQPRRAHHGTTASLPSRRWGKRHRSHPKHMLKSITLEVTGDQKLVCEGCEERVERVLKTLERVDRVNVSTCSLMPRCSTPLQSRKQ
jgi:hypothetical protein